MEQECPVMDGRDDRKTAAVAAANLRLKPGAKRITGFKAIRDFMRSPDMRQAGAGDGSQLDPELTSFFFLDGEQHRRRRAAVANYFTPQAIAERYHSVMTSTMAGLVAELRRTGSAKLDHMSFQLAVAVAAQVVGLTETDTLGLSKRMGRALHSGLAERRNAFQRVYNGALLAFNMWNFYRTDLKPAIRVRQTSDRDDVIGHMVREGYKTKMLLIECMTYATAGMVTTREFIVMCAWHLFDNPALRERFMSGDERDQLSILYEILRLEPITTMLYRRAANNIEAVPEQIDTVREGDVLGLDIRAANTDETVVGTCPYALDPDRARRMKQPPSFLSFGEGSHRCPGSQVALHETRIFLNELFRIPGIRLATPPKPGWSQTMSSYDLRGAVLTCDKLN